MVNNESFPILTRDFSKVSCHLLDYLYLPLTWIFLNQSRCFAKDMAGDFAHLPTELIAAIISEVKDIKTLRSLARCSSLCYELVLPHLYRDIQLTYYYHHLVGCYDDAIRHAYKLLCVLLRDPSKAACVRSLTVVRKYVPQSPNALSILKQRSYAPGIKKEDLDQRILDLVPPHEFDEHGNHPWLTPFAQCRDSSVALLILLPRLPSLQHVCIAAWLPPANCSSLLQPQSSNTTSLSLPLLETPLPSILPYVGACRTLRALELEWVSGYFAWESNGLLRPQSDDLNRLLLTIGEELDSIALVYKSASRWFQWYNFPNPLTSLTRFTKLRVIKLSMAIIFGERVHENWVRHKRTRLAQKLVGHLPPLVELLHVIQNDHDDFDLLLKSVAVVVAAASEKRKFAYLQSIIIEQCTR